MSRRMFRPPKQSDSVSSERYDLQPNVLRVHTSSIQCDDSVSTWQLIVFSCLVALGVADIVWLNVSLAPKLAAVFHTIEMKPVINESGGAKQLDANQRDTHSDKQAKTASGENNSTLNRNDRSAEETALSVEITERVLPEKVPDIRFQTNATILNADAHHILHKVSLSLKHDKHLTVVARGHSDSRGNRTQNMRLSRQRAEAVAAYLRTLGVPSSQIFVESVGSTKPGKIEAAFAYNRRVQLLWRRRKGGK